MIGVLGYLCLMLIGIIGACVASELDAPDKKDGE